MPAAAPAFAVPASTVNDFDFLVGRWRVHHRRLKERLASSTHWQEFGGTTAVQQLMGGQANFDDNVIDLPDGTYPAVTLRAFDPQTSEWAIWWLDGRSPRNVDPPMRGTFVNGVGTFLAEDTFRGKPIRVRFLWSHITPTSCRWEQAFSPDAGDTWEPNWIMEFTRA